MDEPGDYCGLCLEPAVLQRTSYAERLYIAALLGVTDVVIDFAVCADCRRVLVEVLHPCVDTGGFGRSKDHVA